MRKLNLSSTLTIFNLFILLTPLLVVALLFSESKESLNTIMITYGVILIYGFIASRVISKIILVPIGNALIAAEKLTQDPNWERPQQNFQISEMDFLTASIENLARNLDNKNSYLLNFSRQVSHELKTPLTSLIGNLENLVDFHEDMQPNQRKHFLQMAHSDAQRMHDLTQQLLFLAKVDIEDIDKSDHPISDVIQEKADEYSRKGIKSTLDLTRCPSLPIQPNGLAIVLDNLWNNTLLHAGPGPEVVITTLIVNDQKQLIYSDSGQGISKENRDKIFAEFFSTAKSQGGTGLGLTIVKSILDRYDASFALNHAKDGFELIITFPNRDPLIHTDRTDSRS